MNRDSYPAETVTWEHGVDMPFGSVREKWGLCDHCPNYSPLQNNVYHAEACQVCVRAWDARGSYDRRKEAANGDA